MLGGVNKVVMMSKENLVRGNTVLAPQYEPSNPDRKQQEELRRVKAAEKANREKRVKNKAKVLMNIGIAFVIGLSIIYRYVVLYNIRQNLTSIKGQIVAMDKENEDLKVVLAKSRRIDDIEKIATEKLHMVRADRNQAVYSDLTKENFKNTSNKNNEGTEAGFLQKIINKLF